MKKNLLHRALSTSLDQCPDVRYIVAGPLAPITASTGNGLREQQRALYMERPVRIDYIPNKVTWHARWEAATRFTLEEAVRYVLLFHEVHGDASDVFITEVVRDATDRDTLYLRRVTDDVR